MSLKTPSPEQIESFLNGHNNKKYVVAIETYYHKNEADVIIHNPETQNKYVEQVKFTPFMFIKELKKCGLTLYGNNKELRDKALKKFGITIKQLKTTDDNGQIERLQNGYKFMLTTTGSYNDLNNFFKDGGIDTREIKSKYDAIKLEYDEIYTEYEVKINEIEKLNGKIEDEKLKFSKYDDQDNEELRAELLSNINFILSQKPTKTGKPRKMTENAFKKKKATLLAKINALEEKINEINDEDLPPIKEELDEKEVLLDEISLKKDCFYYLGLNEQFMISTGIRLFKGYENYNDVEKFTFDIETTGLDPRFNRIFLIGCKTNKGFQKILSCKNEDDDESERNLILNFFHLLCKKMKPAIMAGYNSEEFDMWFILERANILNLDLTKIQTTFNDQKNEDGETFLRNLVRKQSNIKFGGDSEKGSKTIIWGINVLDTQNAVRRAKAINSDIKEFKLKYIAKYAKVAKENRTYIEGDKIYKMWFNNYYYIINPKNNKYHLIPEEFGENTQTYIDSITPIELNNIIGTDDKTQIVITNGKELVTNYLIDDLQETEDVDRVYNESSFMLSKMLPMSFTKTASSGGAGPWNLIMTAWSYENNLAIPYGETKRKFVGGLSRTYRLGYNKNILKADFAGLYPSIMLTHNIFPRHDVDGVLKGILSYFRDARNKYKKLAKSESDPLLQKFYDTKQLPIKILNNSLFGAFGSIYMYWSDFNNAEEITCRGRLYLRKMLRYFIDKGFSPVILDTDGVSLSIPDEYPIKFIVELKNKTNNTVRDKQFDTYEEGKAFIDDYINNITKDISWTKKKGDVYDCEKAELKLYLDETDIEEIFEDINANVMNLGTMKVDNDGRWESCITVARKNYANLEYDGKIKMVGNSIKSSKLPTYIDQFMNKGLKMLLKGDGDSFVEYYYNHLSDIFFKEIPLKDIASKSRIKLLPKQYMNRGLNKAGKAKGKQIHMELVVRDNVKVSMGDTIYYVNNGTKKKDTDTSINKETNDFNCYLISEKELETNPNKKGDYNVAKYLEAFNNSITPLLIGFDENIIENLIQEDPSERKYFTQEETKLKYYDYDDYPFAKNKIDSIDELFVMDEREVEFWNNMAMNPNEIFDGFTSETPINYEYINRYQVYKSKLNEKNITLKRENETLYNEDIFLRHDKESDKYYLSIMEQANISDLKDVTVLE
jgi:DNA polymerase elongation subunit (family B)